MTTTYILHGGKTSIDSLQNDLFFKQFIDLVDKKEVKILMNYWARPKDPWQELLQRDSAKVERQTTKKVSFSIPADPKDLFAKLPDFDVLYVAGGDAPPIEAHLPQLKDLEKAIQGKVYCGSSMGAFIISKHYVLSNDDQDHQTVHHGLGVIDIMTLCHWDMEDKKSMKLDLLKQQDPYLPILTLNEQEFTTFVK